MRGRVGGADLVPRARDEHLPLGRVIERDTGARRRMSLVQLHRLPALPFVIGLAALST
jgi:hypothetical protein